MKFSVTTSDLNTPTTLERRGAGRATNLHHITNSTVDISQAENTSLPDGTNEIVDRNATPATFSEVVSSGYSENDLMLELVELQNESTLTLNLDENGQPMNSVTWSVIIAKHLRKKSHEYSAKVNALRRERLLLLVGLTSWKYSGRIRTLNRKLYEETNNPIYDTDR